MAARPYGVKRMVLAVILVSVGMSVAIYRWKAVPVKELPPFPWGELRIGVDASFPPFAFAYPDGSLGGLDVDLGFALGTELDIPVRLVNMGADGLYDALKANQVDILISALRVEAWRLGDVRYTRPYFDAGLLLVSHVDNAASNMRALTGKSLAYEFGSSADAEARRWLRRVQPFETQPYELSDYALDAVRLGLADAALVDAVSVHLYLRDHPDWQVHTVYVTHAPLVIAVRLHRWQTLEKIDRALGEILRKGIVDEIINQWLCA